MTAPETSPQQPHTPERPRRNDRFDGLHGRLLLSDSSFLNAEKKVTGESGVFIPPFKEQDYKPFETTSGKDRGSFWKKMVKDKKADDTPEAQYALWEESMINFVNAKQKGPTKEFYDRLFNAAEIRVGTHDQPFDATHASTMYDRYFVSEDKLPGDYGIKLFVRDVLTVHAAPPSGFDTKKLENNMHEIKQFARIFGDEKESIEMIEHLIRAEIKLFSDGQFIETITQTQRMNEELNDDEKRILRYIYESNNPAASPQPPEEEPLTTSELPIMAYKEAIQQQLLSQEIILLIGGTGCGKSLRTPQFIRPLLKPGEKLYVTQPTQINAKKLAEGIARESKVTLGEEIGFQHGDAQQRSKDTDTLFLTEKSLILKLLNPDQELNDLRYVMVDEVHKQSKDTEILLELLKREQQRRKDNGLKPLTILAASATVDKGKFEEYFGLTNTIEVPGKTYPIEKRYTTYEPSSPDIRPPFALLAKQEIDLILEEEKDQDEKGNILIFEPGQGEIEEMKDALMKAKESDEKKYANIEIITLSRASPKEVKDAVGEKTPLGTRRIIIATNVVETGITIKGLKYVIDTGQEYQNIIDPESGLESVVLTESSHAACKQREGRVGRESQGTYIHLRPKAFYDKREPFSLVDMERSDITDVILLLKKNGIDITDLDLLSYPQDKTRISDYKREAFEERIRSSEETLRRLKVVDSEGKLTDIGERMADFPIDFHLAKMIAEAEAIHWSVNEMCTLAALLTGKPILNKDSKVDAYTSPSSDFLTLLNIWKAYTELPKDEAPRWAQEHGLNLGALKKVSELSKKLLKLAKTNKIQSSTDLSEEDQEKRLQDLVFRGYSDKIMFRPQNKDYYLWIKDREIRFPMVIDQSSVLYSRNEKDLPEYIIAAGNSRYIPGKTTEIRVSPCQAVQPN